MTSIFSIDGIVWCFFVTFIIRDPDRVVGWPRFLFCVLSINKGLQYTYMSRSIVFLKSQLSLASATDDFLLSARINSLPVMVIQL